MSATITACLIVRNEAQLIARCLEAVSAFCDDVVVVDTGSTDDTVEIARRGGARVLFHRWTGDYGRARNVYLRAVRTDWILVIDGDETIAREDVPRIAELISARSAQPGGYRVTVRNYTADFNVAWNWHANDGRYRDEERFSGCPGWTRTRALRLFRNLPRVCYPTGAASAHVTPAASLSRLGARISNADAVVVHHFECVKRGGVPFIRRKQQARLRAEIARACRPPYDADAFINVAKTLFAQRKDDEAVRILSRAVKRYPQFADAHRLWGMVELARGRLSSATRHLQNAADIDPDCSDSWAMLGIACVEAGDMPAARRALERALTLQPDHLLACNSLGVLYEDLGHRAKARRQYSKALRLHPGFTPARQNLSRLDE